MTPQEVTKLVLDGLRADLHITTLEGDPAMEMVLTWGGQTFCRAVCALPDAENVPRADCPHPHSSADDVRTALLGVVSELRRAGKICEGTGQHYRADAFNDAAAYIEEGKWPSYPADIKEKP